MIKERLLENATGFHFSGFNQKGIPEFLHFSNCHLVNGKYQDIIGEFRDIIEDFLSNDAKVYGWDGINADSIKAKNQIRLYRNGHILVHSIVIPYINGATEIVLNQPGFKKPKWEKKRI